MQNSNNGAAITLGIVAFIFVAVWWIEDRFGANAVGWVGIFIAILIVIAAITYAVFFGFRMASQHTQGVMETLNEYNRQDAQIDRYRQQSFVAMARGEAAERTADAKLRVIEGRSVDKLSNHRAKLLMDVERQKWLLEQQNRDARTPVDAAPDDFWAEDDDDQDGWG